MFPSECPCEHFLKSIAGVDFVSITFFPSSGRSFKGTSYPRGSTETSSLKEPQNQLHAVSGRKSRAAAPLGSEGACLGAEAGRPPWWALKPSCSIMGSVPSRCPRAVVGNTASLRHSLLAVPGRSQRASRSRARIFHKAFCVGAIL